MKRFLLLWLCIASILCGAMTPAQMVVLFSESSPYIGPLNIVPNATAFYSLRCGSTALATGRTNVVNVREAKTNSTMDIVCLSNGNFDTATAAAFAPLDATGTGAITGTALTFTGGHVNDTVTGGTVAPGTYIVSGVSPAWTVNISQTVVSSTLTLTYALFVTKWYDQSGNICDSTQITAAKQPQLLPSVFSNKGGILFLRGASTQFNSCTISSLSQPLTLSSVAERTASFTSFSSIIANGAGTGAMLFQNSANLLRFNFGSPVTESAADAVLHAIQYTVSGASSFVNIDGTASGNINTGATGMGTSFQIGNDGSNDFLDGFINELGVWSGGKTTTQQANLCHNQTYWAAFGC